ncbi:four-carbon acid sugar kinase family protein [Pseudonocardia kongjuensis]|uniref:Four-carbon acid sugar kinase family protein n=1 Tax=Pseudonocardia kongjuensis TaxID=102227 RepID=A0ABN1XN16_9PSEU
MLAAPGEPATILLDAGAPLRQAGLTVVDLHCRGVDATEAARRTADALTVAAPGTRPFLKIDSLLRGNVAAGVGALATHEPVVVAAALPAAGRTVRDGVVHLGAEPLHRTAAWQLEPGSPPPDVPAALGLPGCPVVDVRTLRRDPVAGLRTALTRAAGAGSEARRGRPHGVAPAAPARHPVVVCDAATDADLDLIAGAVIATGAAPAGSGAFAAAFGRVTGRPGLGAGPAPRGPVRPVLAVVGSAEPAAARQVELLLAEGAADLRPGDPPRASRSGITVLRPDPRVAGDPVAVAEALTRAAVTLAGGPAPPHLLLTGGETARRVLDALGVDRLEPLGAVAHGAVRSRTATGRQVVTRPGSFGDDTSLRAMAAAVLPPPTDRKAAV